MKTIGKAGWGSHALAAGVAAMLGWTGCSAKPNTLPDDTGGGGGGAATTSTTGHTTGGGGGHATGAGGAGPVCPGAKLCGDKCTNTDFDPQNCGQCGAACPQGQLCSKGVCSIACAGGTTQCGDACVDAQSDHENCGTCGKICSAGEVCSKGACSLECLGGSTQCGSTCVDVQNDPQNCGGCGTACKPGEVCAAGQCGVTCLGGSTQCGDTCVDVQNDPANCGKCGAQCPAGQVCSTGVCALSCGVGTQKCGAKCVATASDPQNCGACGLACSGGQACFSGKCGLCGPGQTQCGQTCVDAQADPKNCGGCGVACSANQVCYNGACAASCGGGLTQCGQTCVDAQKDVKNCGACGKTCGLGGTCQNGACVECDSNVTDCDGDGWMVADGDCCDKPGLCGADPSLVNPGAIEVVGNGLDDNCNGLVDLFDTQDTVSCDNGLASDSKDAGDFAKAIGLCRTTTENPPLLKDKTWGLLSAEILLADGTPLQDFEAVSIRTAFGSINPPTTEGQSVLVISSGIAADATETMPGPNGGAPGGFNVSTSHNPPSQVDLSAAGLPTSVADWYATPNPPLKGAGSLPGSPGCNASNESQANDSVMLHLRLRAPTNVKAFSFNSYFISAEYPEFVCTSFNDQFIALVDTPNGVPSPLPNPIDKNLMTYTQGQQKWPIGINIAKGTSLFAVCNAQQLQDPSCLGGGSPDLSSCSLGDAQLKGTGFEAPVGDTCNIGGGTFWLTTAGNVIPGDIVELRIAVWDVGDSAFDSLAVIDGFRWLPNATLAGTQ
jgi:hypothetical protein